MNIPKFLNTAMVLASLASVSWSCDDDAAADHDSEGGHGGAGNTGEHAAEHGMAAGPATGAKCPESGSSLTYENFAKQFVADYCLSCHSQKVTGAARNKAPADHNFDTYADVDLIGDHIDQVAGSGPAATNTKMPPATTARKPTMEERAKLSEWIACGKPEK